MGAIAVMKSSSLQYLSPKSLIEAAKAAHPAFRYAIVVAGLAAIVSVVLRFGASPATLVFGIIILVALMVLFLIFTQAATMAKADVALPALVLIWSFLILSIVTAVCLFTSAFFDQPLPLKTAIIRSAEESPAEQIEITHTSQPRAPSTSGIQPMMSIEELNNDAGNQLLAGDK
jgi:hypothetical protein